MVQTDPTVGDTPLRTLSGEASARPGYAPLGNQNKCDRYGRKKPLFCASAIPPQRVAERNSYTTSSVSPQVYAAILLPKILCFLILVISLLFMFRIISSLTEKTQEEWLIVPSTHSSKKHAKELRWYHVFRLASGKEVQNGRLVELNYTDCGKEIAVGCWAETTADKLPKSIPLAVNERAYVRKVYSFTVPTPQITCPPSLFITEDSEYSPVVANCTSIYD